MHYLQKKKRIWVIFFFGDVTHNNSPFNAPQLWSSLRKWEDCVYFLHQHLTHKAVEDPLDDSGMYDMRDNTSTPCCRRPDAAAVPTANLIAVVFYLNQSCGGAQQGCYIYSYIRTSAETSFTSKKKKKQKQVERPLGDSNSKYSVMWKVRLDLVFCVPQVKMGGVMCNLLIKFINDISKLAIQMSSMHN